MTSIQAAGYVLVMLLAAISSFGFVMWALEARRDALRRHRSEMRMREFEESLDRTSIRREQLYVSDQVEDFRAELNAFVGVRSTEQD